MIAGQLQNPPCMRLLQSGAQHAEKYTTALMRGETPKRRSFDMDIIGLRTSVPHHLHHPSKAARAATRQPWAYRRGASAQQRHGGAAGCVQPGRDARPQRDGALAWRLRRCTRSSSWLHSGEYKPAECDATPHTSVAAPAEEGGEPAPTLSTPARPSLRSRSRGILFTTTAASPLQQVGSHPWRVP